MKRLTPKQAVIRHINECGRFKLPLNDRNKTPLLKIGNLTEMVVDLDPLTNRWYQRKQYQLTGYGWSGHITFYSHGIKICCVNIDGFTQKSYSANVTYKDFATKCIIK